MTWKVVYETTLACGTFRIHKEVTTSGKLPSCKVCSCQYNSSARGLQKKRVLSAFPWNWRIIDQEWKPFIPWITVFSSCATLVLPSIKPIKDLPLTLIMYTLQKILHTKQYETQTLDEKDSNPTDATTMILVSYC